MVIKHREHGSKVKHCSPFHVSFRFSKHSQNVYQTEAVSPGAHRRFVLATFYVVRFSDVLLRSATFPFVILPMGIGLQSRQNHLQSPGAPGGGFDGPERAGTRLDGRKQGRNSADGCGGDRALHGRTLVWTAAADPGERGDWWRCVATAGKRPRGRGWQHTTQQHVPRTLSVSRTGGASSRPRLHGTVSQVTVLIAGHTPVGRTRPYIASFKSQGCGTAQGRCWWVLFLL